MLLAPAVVTISPSDARVFLGIVATVIPVLFVAMFLGSNSVGDMMRPIVSYSEHKIIEALLADIRAVSADGDRCKVELHLNAVETGLAIEYALEHLRCAQECFAPSVSSSDTSGYQAAREKLDALVINFETQTNKKGWTRGLRPVWTLLYAYIAFGAEVAAIKGLLTPSLCIVYGALIGTYFQLMIALGLVVGPLSLKTMGKVGLCISILILIAVSAWTLACMSPNVKLVSSVGLA